MFDYLEQENPNCKIVFISATPFSALYAAGADSILRHQFNTRLVFHKTSHEYRGIREMHKNLQIVKLDNEQRDFCETHYYGVALFASYKNIKVQDGA